MLVFSILLPLLFLQEGAEQKAAELVEQLGAEKIETREQATFLLLALGEKARAPLKKALDHDDAEVRLRARTLLRKLDRIAFFRGGIFGNRLKGKLKALEIAGGSSETEGAVSAGLKWLARHQAKNGSWKTSGYSSECGKIGKTSGGGRCVPNPGHKDLDDGVTGLALLAFLGAGQTHLSKDKHDGIHYGDVVRKAIQRMMSRQDREGCITSRNNQKYMYSHAICTLALVEARALTKSNLFKDTTRKAIDFLVKAQNPGMAWRYSYRCGDNDTSVTFWAALALRAGAHAGFTVPDSAFDGTKAWLDEVTDRNYGRVGYTHKNTRKVFVPGLNEKFDHHEALTSAGVFHRIILGEGRSKPVVSSGVHLLLRDYPRWERDGIDFYYWHLGTLALFQYDGPNGDMWSKWNTRLKEALVKHQNPAGKGCKAGSWEPVGRWCREGGRVYATALNVLTLETYYRYRIVPRPTE